MQGRTRRKFLFERKNFGRREIWTCIYNQWRPLGLGEDSLASEDGIRKALSHRNLGLVWECYYLYVAEAGAQNPWKKSIQWKVDQDRDQKCRLEVFGLILHAVRATANKGISCSRYLWWPCGKQMMGKDQQQKSIRRQVIQMRDNVYCLTLAEAVRVEMGTQDFWFYVFHRL